MSKEFLLEKLAEMEAGKDQALKTIESCNEADAKNKEIRRTAEIRVAGFTGAIEQYNALIAIESGKEITPVKPE